MKKFVSDKSALALAAVMLVIGKAMAAISKIPLSAALGASGFGVYCAAFPLFGFTTTLSSGGISACVSAAVANDDVAPSEKTLSFLTKLALTVSALFAAALFFAADAIAGAQGFLQCSPVYRALCPAVAICAVEAVIKGVICGKRRFLRSAAAEMTGQTVKAALVPLLACLATALCPERAAPLSAIGVVISETASLAVLLAAKRKVNLPCGECDKKAAVRLLVKSLPVALTGVLAPLLSLADSFIIPNVLLARSGAEHAAALYGVKEAVAGAILSLPASVYAAAYSYFLPKLSSKEGQNDFTKVIGCFFCAGLALFAALYSLADCAVSFLFPSLDPFLADKAVSLIRIGAAGAFFSAITQAFSALFHSRGKTGAVFFVRAACGALRAAACFFLTRLFGVGGAALSQVLSAAVTACVTSVIGALRLSPDVSVKRLIRPTASCVIFCVFLIAAKPAFSALPPFFCAALSLITAIFAAALPLLYGFIFKKRQKNAPTDLS